jgi:arsenical pump membrane protein
VFAVASTVTAVLSLDATVVLLTPVVFATVARLRLRPKPHIYACTHLANSASLLLPVSNLTNLLAFSASGLSFARFGATMALPWLAAIAVEWLVLRRFFAADLIGHTEVSVVPRRPAPVYACLVLGLTLVGFFLTSLPRLRHWAALSLSAYLCCGAGAPLCGMSAWRSRCLSSRSCWPWGSLSKPSRFTGSALW